MHAIEAKSLTKTYPGGTQAVFAVSEVVSCTKSASAASASAPAPAAASSAVCNSEQNARSPASSGGPWRWIA